MKHSIWSEGYECTGNSAGAMYHGVGEGDTFADACMNFALKNPDFAEYYDPQRVTYWGCRLYDNESDARRSFG